MKAILVTRYPRVDTPAWKRTLAQGLIDAGVEVGVLASRAALRDQVEAGLREFGPADVLGRYLSLRGRGARDQAPAAPPLSGWAAERGLATLECRRLGDPDAIAALRAENPDLLALTGADIVPASVLAVPRIGTINAHYGLLPAYRGMNVTEWSVYHGAPVGVTVHLVDPGIDTGDILEREEIAIEPGETFETLRAKHQSVAGRLLLKAALALRDGVAERTPQRPEEGRQYYRMHPELRRIAEARLAARAATGAS